MEGVLYKGRQIEAKVYELKDGGFSIAANVITDEGGTWPTRPASQKTFR